MPASHAQRPRTDRAFERLYRRHVREVYRYALVVLRSADAAEVVARATFLTAYQAFNRGERPHPSKTWLIAIAHELCRRRAEEVDGGQPDDIAAEGDSTERDVRRALSRLPFEQRSALVMREVEGRSYADVAAILGLSVGAVETLIFRGRRALRERLEGTLTCHEAERAISLRLDRLLARSERRALRSHLRECGECADVARSQRARRRALRSLAEAPLPSSLSSFLGAAAPVGRSLGRA